MHSTVPLAHFLAYVKLLRVVIFHLDLANGRRVAYSGLKTDSGLGDLIFGSIGNSRSQALSSEKTEHKYSR
jgi:hypothetical protein